MSTLSQKKKREDHLDIFIKKVSRAIANKKT